MQCTLNVLVFCFVFDVSFISESGSQWNTEYTTNISLEICKEKCIKHLQSQMLVSAGLSISLWVGYFADPTTDPSMLWAEPFQGELHCQGCLAKTLYLVQSSEMQCECLLLSFSTLVSWHSITSSHPSPIRGAIGFHISNGITLFAALRLYPDYHDFENILIYSYRQLM